MGAAILIIGLVLFFTNNIGFWGLVFMIALAAILD